MQSLSEHQLLISLLALSIMLLTGRATAEIARRFGQPEVLGELIGGFILGPSVLGVISASGRHALFGDPGVALPLSMFSWMGAILLLMLAGAEVDLNVLLEHWKPGVASAVSVILPSILIGTAFGIGFLHQPVISSIFLGATLSVTAVGVIAKFFMEQGVLRRSYAQVIMAAGIASEIVVWPIISALSSMKEGESWIAGLFTALYAVLFFSIMLTVGQKFIDWAMRRITDATQIIQGQLTLIVTLGMLFACVTQKLGLHALLGPFAIGLLIARAPRTTNKIKESLQALTMSIFAPVFFVSAGMRIDATKIVNAESLMTIAALFLVASLTKLAFGWLGARVGGLRPMESLLVGLGTNMKGGTDVVVAILGVALGLLPDYIYSVYAIVAMLTVFVSPIAITTISKNVTPTDAESERLQKEEAKRRAYFSSVEKVLLPSFQPLRPIECVAVLKLLALGKDSQKEVFDIMELEVDQEHSKALEVASTELKEETDTAKIEYLKTTTDIEPIEAMITNAQHCDLVLIGAARPKPTNLLTLGHMQDEVISKVKRDCFVVIGGAKILKRRLRRILVPVNGLEHSMAAADIAGYIAEASDAELIFLTVVHHEDKVSEGNLTHYRISRAGAKILKEAKFRTGRLNIRHREIIKISTDVNATILKELKLHAYDMVVLGAVDRSSDAGIYLGKCVQTVLTETMIPAGILIYRPQTREAAGEEISLDL
jgi:Kef-type K+ transport system membrane component KefB/nucleotide-binding universal stress UspA family protein